jgi:uncharacterized membrane protein
VYQIGYILGGAMVVVGTLILLGVIELQAGTVPMLRIMFGLVLLLYGVYRLSTTEMERRRRGRA